jgi:hypothetical protein
MRAIGMFLASALLASCAADMGTPGAETGSTSQALTSTGSMDAFTGSAVFDRGSACVVNDGTKDLIIYAGGYTSLSPKAVSSTIRLMDPAAATQWLTPTISGSITARAEGKLILDPNDSTKKTCLYVGGLDASTPQLGISTTEKLVLSGTGPYTITVSTGPTGFTARGALQVAKCGADSLVAVAGIDNGSTKNTIQVLQKGGNWTTPAAAAGSSNTLNASRRDFAFAGTDQSNNVRFTLGGGKGALGELNSIETLVFSKSSFDCDTVQRNTQTATLTNSAEGVVAFPTAFSSGSPDSSTIQATAGYNGSATVFATTDTLSVTWGATPAVTKSSGTALTNAVGFPTLTQKAALDYYVSGGIDGTGAAVTFIQENNAGTWSSVVNFGTARAGHPTVFSSTFGNLVSFGGHTSTTVLGSNEKIVP